MKEFINLDNKICVTIKAKTPFNFRYTVHKPSHFPTTLEFYDEKDDCLYRSVRLGKSCYGLKMHSLKKSEIDRGIVLQIFSSNPILKSEIRKIEERVSRSYGLKEDVTTFYSSVKDMKGLSVIKRLEGMRNSCIEDLYEILNIAIILQNANVQRSTKMLEGLLHQYGERVCFDGVLLDVFYDPERLYKIADSQLRELGLGYRSRYVSELAELFHERRDLAEEIRRMPPQNIRKTLLGMKGIGPYSANLVLFSYFRSPEFVNLDVWNRKIMSNFLFGREVDLTELENECQKRWGDFKGYMALYIIEDSFLGNCQSSEKLNTGDNCSA